MWKEVVPEQGEICPVRTGHGQLRGLEEDVVYQACPGVLSRKKETSTNAHEMRMAVHAGLCGYLCACLHLSF